MFEKNHSDMNWSVSCIQAFLKTGLRKVPISFALEKQNIYLPLEIKGNKWLMNVIAVLNYNPMRAGEVVQQFRCLLCKQLTRVHPWNPIWSPEPSKNTDPSQP